MYNSYNYNSPATQSSDEPDEGPLIGLVKHLNKNELTDLLENETKVLEMVCDNPQIKAMRTTKETTEASIKSLAEYNMNQKPRIEEKRESLKSLHKALNDRREQFDIARVKYDSIGNVSPDDILALLQAAVAEVEEKSEGTASAFLAGEIDCESFMAQFRRERKLAHQRRIRSEKITELAVNTPQASGHQAPPVAPAPIAPTAVSSSMTMPTAGPPPLPPRNYTVGGPAPFAPANHDPAPHQTVLPPRPPASAANYWGQPSMPMPQPYGPATGPGMYGAVGGGYNHYFHQQRM